MRLFVAIDLDDSARFAVSGEQRRMAGLGEPHSALRWVRPEQLHLTLAFLGEVDEKKVSEVTTVVSRPVDQASFEVVFEGLGIFPPRGAPRALWTGVSSGAAELRALERVINERLASAGFLLDDRPFSPHLTLARWKFSRPSDRARALASARQGVVARIPVDRATLYGSRLSSAGPVYTELARANLTARG